MSTQHRSLMLFDAPPMPMIVAPPAWVPSGDADWAIALGTNSVRTQPRATRDTRRPIAAPEITNRACFIDIPHALRRLVPPKRTFDARRRARVPNLCGAFDAPAVDRGRPAPPRRAPRRRASPSVRPGHAGGSGGAGDRRLPA